MAWTEQDYQEIVARLMAESIGVNEVPDAGSTDDISSLPAYQPANGTEVPTVVKASLELLVAPALEAADKANEAADKAESNATAAQTAANTANEKAELAAQAASDATAAKEEAETATQSANNAASNAEEKAEAANTAAQDAEKVANNPTYIGTDHYVYVYNKETDSFDKTGIYCKGEPGSSFRVAGEYATLEALKSAVPDGSTIDGFMAVGTEAPYDYYAWVNGDWVNQGKIAGGGSGNVIVIPAAAMSLSDQATSDEIFNAFGGKDAFMDICQSIVNKDTVCVVANIPEESGMKIVYIPAMAMATYTDANNANLMIAIITQTTFQLGITVTDGVATQSSQVLNHIYEAPSDGNVYGRKNKNWVKVLEKSDVDDSISSARNAGYMMQLTEIDASGLDENTWYPVVMSLGNRNTVRIEVLVGLDSATIPSWSTHYNGFSVRKIWEVNGDGWGATHINRQIFVSDYKFANTDPVRGVEQLCNTSDEYVFVRGGGKYFFYTSHGVTPVLYTDTYTSGASTPQSISPTTEAPAEIVANMATIDKVNELIQKALTGYVKSDNITTITKKTAAEYEDLGSKDANTVYCVTD
ncbi:phage upper tail fiber protein [Bacteroides clarus]|uniref:phage upper tail fiber protein n=1 Tax=Bacteroides clarus TaxID=626929 RepID=UPI0018996B92|nr:hypothetical protein [Bacteroides clarus]